MLNEREQVLGVLGQRRRADEKDRQPVVKIGAKAPALRLLRQRPVVMAMFLYIFVIC